MDGIMGLSVTIYTETQEGQITYDDTTKDLNVEFPDELLRSEIEEYLTTPQVFRIPQSPRIDDFKEVHKKPIASTNYLKQALGSIRGSIDHVLVRWDTLQED